MSHNSLKQEDKQTSRRSAMKAAGGLGALFLLACGTNASSTSDGGSGGGSGGGTGGGGGSSGADGGAPGADAGGQPQADAGTFAGDAGVDSESWATGSGAFLEGKSYGDPFASGIGSTCTAWKAATEGPCHSNTYFRKDVSDGLVGLPTRLELLIVDTACNPIPNAVVEIWYASPAGTYSKAAEALDAGTGYGGSLSDLNVGFCTGNNTEALASNWLRGYQLAGADGRVTIDGIFPGWYSGRTTHIHFSVTANGKTFTSQLFVDDALNTLIYTTHGAYKARGQKNTTNATDNVVSQSGLSLSSVVMSYAQQPDGALVLWKALALG